MLFKDLDTFYLIVNLDKCCIISKLNRSMTINMTNLTYTTDFFLLNK